MIKLRQPYLITENLGYELDSTRVLFQGINLSLLMGDRIALVGANGVGKSTLLKILAGQMSPKSGSIVRHGVTYYLPQISTLPNSLSSQSVLDFLTTTSNEWWEIAQWLETTFSTMLDLSLPLHTLSGGELTKLLIAVGLARSPDLLFLDEPTNHLDYLAIAELQQILDQFQGAFVLVSHKPWFLNQVAKTIWELTPDGLQIYGGTFSDYRQQKQIETVARVRSHETARKELKRAKAAALQEQQRAAQSQRNGRQKGRDLPRIVAGNLKRQAETTAGTLKVKHERAIAIATQQVAETKVKTQKVTNIRLEEHNQKHKILITIDQANLWINADQSSQNLPEARLLISNIQLQISSGDRLAVAGLNGSGKSCLIKAILGLESVAVLDGEVQLAQMQTVYLDQNYALIDRTRTVLENMQQANPMLSYQMLRQQLGHFLFFDDEVYKPASLLSGGELARLAIAMITISELDLLILDEPTNNLDITTVDQMVDALNDYQGALWVISHDLDFLSRINITRSLHIQHQTLQAMVYLPDERLDYQNELLGLLTPVHYHPSSLPR